MAKKKATKKSVTKKKPTKKSASKKKVKKKSGMAKAVAKATKKARARKKKQVAAVSGWRKDIAEDRIQFTDDKKEGFCKAYANCGRMYQAAKKVGVTYECVRSHLKIDLEFQTLFEEARQAYADKVHQTVELVAIEGVDKPIVGGRNKDRIITYEKVFATNILAMEMKRTNPEYREKSEVDVNVQGGVLLIPAPMTQEAWIEKFAKPQPDGAGNVYEQGRDY